MNYLVRSKTTFSATVELVERGRVTLRLRPGFDVSALVKFTGADDVLVTMEGDTPVNDELEAKENEQMTKEEARELGSELGRITSRYATAWSISMLILGAGIGAMPGNVSPLVTPACIIIGGIAAVATYLAWRKRLLQ